MRTFIASSEKRKLSKKIHDLYGIDEIPLQLIRENKHEIYGFSGNLTKEEIKIVEQNARVEVMGLKIADERDNMYLTCDAMHILKSSTNKKCIEITENEAETWFFGKDIPHQTKKGMYVIVYNNIILGTTKATGQKLTNTLPKERQRKN